MRRIRIVVEYDGTGYVGWQVQDNGVSVQSKLEDAIRLVTGERVRVEGSGRTDSGVHARAQVAHFDTDARMQADKFAVAMNMHLPFDIRVLHAAEVTSSFHSRFSAKEKTYRYALQTGPHARVFTRNTALHVHAPLDLKRMNAAAQDVLGEHDFCAFMSKNTAVEHTVRTVSLSRWTQEGNLMYYDVTGNGFLYNMVRILVGTMLEIGAGKRGTDAVKRALASGNRLDAGATAPARGLTLCRVRYADFDTDEVVRNL